MSRTLDLVAEPVSGLAVEGEGPLAVYRVVGLDASLRLQAAGSGFSLSPGLYQFELELRADSPANPYLVCELAGAPARRVTLDQTSAFRWRADIEMPHTITAIVLALPGMSGRFFIARCCVSTETLATVPNLGTAVAQAVLAFYRLAPRSIRRTLGPVWARRIPGFRRWRTSISGATEDFRGGEMRVTGGARESDAQELDARRADFDARFAVARGLDRAEVSQAPPPPRRCGEGSARVVAFHLPQYHRIPENDAWWGPGFTEWTNVSKAVPQFVGHYQPRLPGELGFYDLTTPGVIRRQVELAKAHGVSAFCFHYYWFGGKRLLERPLDAFIADRSLDCAFALCWANENWTRRWDGAEDAVLIAQEHSREDHARVFDDIARYLEDPRAIKIGGKPLIVVYRPAIITDARAMTEIWRERAQARGWPGLYLAATEAFQFETPTAVGFDGLIEFPPHGLEPPRIEDELVWLNTQHNGFVFDYAATANEAVARLNRRRSSAFDRFPCVMPGWDNEARRPGAGRIFHGATPEAYAGWLDAACDAAERTLPADRRLVFINAWNEWAEGAYLEPDRKWGRAFLEATARVVGVGG